MPETNTSLTCFLVGACFLGIFVGIVSFPSRVNDNDNDNDVNVVCLLQEKPKLLAK